MIRGLLLALSLLAFSGDVCADEFADISGAWSGETSPDLEFPPYFTATFTQDGDALTGVGVSNRCPACRGFDEYNVRWEGRIEGRELSMMARHTDRPWEPNQHYDGVLSADGRTITGTFRNGQRAEPFVMTRVEQTP